VQAAGEYAVSGTVTSAGGAPLDDAVVTLADAGMGGSVDQETTTSQTGAFRFTGVPAGTYVLSAARRGYASERYQQHGRFSTAVVTGPGLSAQNLRIALQPWAAIDGSVTDDFGEPVPGAQVQLWVKRREAGAMRYVRSGQRTTDDTGTYEFAALRPGTYFLGVTANPWYAFHPPPRRDKHGQLLPESEQPSSPLDVVYPMTFYEDATDSDAATPIAVHAGDRLQIHVAMHATPAIHLRIRVAMPQGNRHRGVAMPQLMRPVFGHDDFLPMTMMGGSVQNGTMTVEMGGLAPGHYVLRSYGRARGGEHEVTVDLTGDQTIRYAGTQASGVSVTGKLGMADGGNLPANVTMELAGADEEAQRRMTHVAPDGTFTFGGVEPGSYTLRAIAPGDALSVVQMAAAGAKVEGVQFTVAGTPVLVAATLARGATEIHGFARQDGRGVGGAMIVLIPDGAQAARNEYRRDQSNTDGSFTLQRVLPGDYTLVAIEDGWELDWKEPAVMAPYMAHGLRVRITADEPVTRLAAALAVQER
jgi:protocatechuate 3,4-dioxygenase beta subunit